MDERWRIELFGGLRARRGERVVTRFRSQKTAVLLAYLARHSGQKHAREVLVELLWPGSRPDAGRSSLGTALWALRRQLESDDTPRGAVVLADRNAVGLNQEAVTTDVTEFEQAVASVHGAAKTKRVPILAQVVGLYTGEFMAGYYEDWLLAEQRRLGGLFHEALATLTRDLEQKGEVTQAIDYAWRGVELDPLREEAHRDLIRLQVAAGRPELALQQYRELERILTRELGSAPSRATRGLIDEIEAKGRGAASVRAVVARARPKRIRIRATLPTQGTFVFLLIEGTGGPSSEALGRE
ncbi:hypothetical protein H8D79_00355, partial [PVC group bacterium]|nr:hypothetical protein [PVC group bacterium]